MSDPSWLVVGLGNPGPDFADTRHNLGYRVADELAARLGAGWHMRRDLRAHVATGRLEVPSVRVMLVKPLTYMNESGGPVSSVAAYFKTAVDRMVIVHDDLDLDFGNVRIKLGGGDGGHNGLRSLRRSLRSGEFYRVRAGVGRPPGRQDPADFVLAAFSTTERASAQSLVQSAADAVHGLMADGLEVTQNRVHNSN